MQAERREGQRQAGAGQECYQQLPAPVAGKRSDSHPDMPLFVIVPVRNAQPEGVDPAPIRILNGESKITELYELAAARKPAQLVYDQTADRIELVVIKTRAESVVEIVDSEVHLEVGMRFGDAGFGRAMPSPCARL